MSATPFFSVAAMFLASGIGFTIAGLVARASYHKPARLPREGNRLAEKERA